MNTRILLAIVVTMFVCQQAHAQVNPVMPEATELEGTWEAVSVSQRGEEIGLPSRVFYRFEGDRSYSRTSDDKDWTQYGTFSVDESALPSEADLWELQAIYKIDNNVLTICIGVERPDAFESTVGSEAALIVLRRVEEDDE